MTAALAEASPPDAMWTLVQRVQAGDADAFTPIYQHYHDTIRRFIYTRVCNRQLAEDLTGETFLRAFRRIDSFTWQGRDLGAWLVTIARNLVIDHFKSGRARLEIVTDDVPSDRREDTSLEGNPEAAIVDHMTNLALLGAVKQLNPEQQECILLRFLRGFSVAETAQAMGKNEGAIKALQYRAVRALHRIVTAPEARPPAQPSKGGTMLDARIITLDRPARGASNALAEYGAWWCPCGWIGQPDSHDDCDAGPVVPVTVAILPREGV